MSGTVKIGVSGWQYPGWKNIFYPGGLAAKNELRYLSREFPTVEINGTFYSMKTPSTFARWDSETPADFLFAIKGSRYITHMKRLREIERPLANFFAQGLLQLSRKLGPILWQFPPDMVYHYDRFFRFFELLPRTLGAAAVLASKHDERLRNRAWYQVEAADGKLPVRHAVEIRNESFVTPEFIELLRRQQIALVVADAVDWPLLMDVTSDFVYLRLHGSEELYSSGYDDTALDAWAQRIDAWARGGAAPQGRYAAAPEQLRLHRDVFVYFDNDAKVRAPFDARRLTRKLFPLQNRVRRDGSPPAA